MNFRMKPYLWQENLLIIPLVRILKSRQSAICTACTGSGKSLTSLAVAKRMGLLPFVVAPKITLPSWQETAEAMDVDLIDAVNIEKLKAGNTRYLTRQGRRFTWNLPRDEVLVIIDEAHGVTGHKTLNSDIAGALKQNVSRGGVVSLYQPKTLFMSATLGETPLKFGGELGRVLGLHNGGGYQWMLSHGCYKNHWNGLDFPTGKSRLKYLEKLHKELYPALGVNLKQSEIPNFPENQIITEMVTIKPKELKDLQKVYDKYEELETYEKDRAAAKGEDASPLTLRIRARQMSEVAKIPSILELTHNLIEEGGSVIIFVSFRDTLEALKQKLKKFNPAIIIGGQKKTKFYDERQIEVDRYLADETRICIASIDAGGTGVSLNDIHGKYPRYSIMSPPQSAKTYVQCIGRPWRTNSMSKSIQYLLLAAGTVEEKIATQLQTKLTNLAAISDSDFWS